MGKHSEIARDLFEQGYNCAQAVFTAFCDEIEMDRTTALKLCSSFGGGMGRLREVCGAVSGMFMVAGIQYGYDDPNDDRAKEEHYQLIQKLAFDFQKKNGSFICRELLGLVEGGASSPEPQSRTPDYYAVRPCIDLVAGAADMLDRLAEERGMEQDFG